MTYAAEIGVVGAGPAGARAAELLAREGSEVLLLDPRAPWEKPCGGGLTAATFNRVPELDGIRGLARRIDLVRLEAPADVAVEVPLDRPLYVIARRDLSRWQLERAVQAGVVFEPRDVKRVEAVLGGWALYLDGGDIRLVQRVVGADGAASTVRRAVTPDLRIERAPTRVLYAHGPGPRPEAIVLRFFAATPGYAWNFPRPDHRSIGIGLEPGDWSRSRLDADLEEYWDVWGRCECVPAVRAGAVIGTAMHQMPQAYPGIGAADFALLGDAAGFADPATGEGIQNALRSAGLLVEAWATSRSFAAYPGLAYAAFEREFRTARAIRRMLHQWRLPVWLIHAAGPRPSARALLAAMVNGENDHDPRLLKRWLRELRRRSGRVQPSEVAGVSACPRAVDGTGERAG